MEISNSKGRGERLSAALGKLLVPCAILSTAVYMGWRIFFTIPFEYGAIAVAFGVMLLAVEIVGSYEAVIHLYAMTDVKSPERPDADESLFPDVDIFIATYNEPPELLYKTINGCLHLDYPDKSKIHIHICDDGRRKEVKELAERLGVGYIKREDNKHAKAGNLNNAMSKTSAPLVVTLDADMIPMSDFLTSCVPYFAADDKLGFLQTPQAFYNMDLYQYYLYSENRIPNEQDYFYKTVQVSRNKLNTVIYGGSNTIILRRALDDIGGFVTDVITEDFATGMAIQSAGYKSVAISDVHASGLSPEDLKSLIKQRERWARGCIQTGRKLNILFRKGLNLRQKISYLSSITYWYSSFKRLFYIISPIVFSIFGVVVVKCTIAELLVFWLPMYLLNRTAIGRLSNNIRSSKWSIVYDTILFPSLLPVVLIEQLGMTKTKFAVTRKDGVIETDKSYQMKQLAPHAILLLLTAAGMASSVIHIFVTGAVRHLYIIFWLSINFYYLLMSVFFMLGRDGYPERKLAAASVDCEINMGRSSVSCVTETISEDEFTVAFNKPKYFEPEKEYRISFYDGRYNAGFKAKLHNVVSRTTGYSYTFRIADIEEKDYRQLLQLVYDREPTMVRHLCPDDSAFDDIRINISERLKKKNTVKSAELLAKISVERHYLTLDGDEIKIRDFYYEYMDVELPDGVLPMSFSIITEKGTRMDCAYGKLMGRKLVRYDIKNYKSLNNIDESAAFWALKLSEKSAVKNIKTEEPDDYTTADSVYEFDEMLYI